MEDLFCIDGRVIKEFIRGRIKKLLDKRELFLFIYIANHNQRFVLRPISYSNKSVVLKLKFYSSKTKFIFFCTAHSGIFYFWCQNVSMPSCRAVTSSADFARFFIGTLHWHSSLARILPE